MTLRWRLAIAATVLVFSIAAAVVFRIRHELDTPYYQGDTGGVFVEIPKGESSGAIAGLLRDAGVLRSKLPFILYVRWSDFSRRMKAGEYRFSTAASPKQVAARIVSGDVYYLSVTVPEGLTARETVELLARNGIGDPARMQEELRSTDLIQDISPDARDLEGYLFPETYRFPRNVSSEAVIKRMVEEFRTRFEAIAARSPARADWSPARVVTLASMIEKEVKAPEERPLVASVLVNRLRTNMPLACDATIIYALKISGGFDGNLHKSDLSMNSPYNTYLYRGLPPGPIANPGESALSAALNPARTEYFYYVSRNDGTHHFSKDYRGHQLAVARYQKSKSRGRKE